MPADVAIEASGLRKSYGEVRALDGVDLHAPTGSVLGLLGPNGAGKTTAVRILTTLLSPDGGSARVAGLDVTLEDRNQAEAATAALEAILSEPPSVLSDGALCFPVKQRQGTIAAAVRRLDEVGIGIDDVAMHRPTLDDVFFGLTGRAASEAESDGAGPDGEER